MGYNGKLSAAINLHYNHLFVMTLHKMSTLHRSNSIKFYKKYTKYGGIKYKISITHTHTDKHLCVNKIYVHILIKLNAPIYWDAVDFKKTNLNLHL